MSAIRGVVGALVLTAAAIAVGCGGELDVPEGSAVASGPVVSGLDVALRTTPDPVRMGENTLEVTVREDGKPVSDASVAVEFHMAAMPSMNMPEMRSRADLMHVGEGAYRGQGQVSMAGNWDVTITVMRGDEELDRRRFTITAR